MTGIWATNKAALGFDAAAPLECAAPPEPIT